MQEEWGACLFLLLHDQVAGGRVRPKGGPERLGRMVGAFSGRCCYEPTRCRPLSLLLLPWSFPLLPYPRACKPMSRFFYHWFRRETVTRALKVAGVVGPILTVINQYDMLLSLNFSPRLFFKIALTFLVPYIVSSFSSARAYMESEGQARQAVGPGRLRPEGGPAAPPVNPVCQ
jgi:hypothetical protein